MSPSPVANFRLHFVALAALAGFVSGCQIRDAESSSGGVSQADRSEAADSRSRDDLVKRSDPGQPLHGPITIDGSSTVYVITQAVTEEFLKLHRQVRVTLGRAGTGGGFKRFDVDDLDICDASRPIEPEEIADCKQNGVEYLELKVALDGLTVVVNPQNTWCRALTVGQLKQIWESGSRVSYWNEIDPAWPATKILLYGPDTDSGTFEYFTEVICGKRGNCRTDFQQSSDDNFLVQGVQGDTGALGYFGYAYSVLNREAVRRRPDCRGLEPSRCGGAERSHDRQRTIFSAVASAVSLCQPAGSASPGGRGVFKLLSRPRSRTGRGGALPAASTGRVCQSPRPADARRVRRVLGLPNFCKAL